MTYAPEPRLWTQAAWHALATKITGMGTGEGDTSLTFVTQWAGNVRWARNRFSTSGDIRNHTLTLARNRHGAGQQITINQLDDPTLHAAMAWVEQAISLYRTQVIDFSEEPPFRADDYLHPMLWFPTTYDVDGAHRAQAAATVISPADRAGMLSAGYLEVSAAGHSVYRPWQAMDLYYPVTEAQYSVTVQDPQRTGSGWAGVNWNDWTKIDMAQLSAIALEKCLTSRNPVAIEPGRYTAILEPQAVFGMVDAIVKDIQFNWADALHPGSNNDPSTNKYHDERSPIQTKIGQLLLDERLSIRADPMDPDLGFVPFNRNGEPYRPAVWFEHGVLKHLPYSRRFAIHQGLGDLGLGNSGNFRLDGSGPVASIAEMIATTDRGLLVTRFSNIKTIDIKSLLLSGYTRDGLWLVEHGKISKAIKNFRFTESPFFAFNNVEQLGVPHRVFNPGFAVVVPAMKIKDFNFSNVSEAI